MKLHKPRPRRTFTSSEAFGNQVYRQLVEDYPLRPGPGPATHYEHEGLIPIKDFKPNSDAELKAMNQPYPPAEYLKSPTHPNIHNLGAVAAANTIPNVPYRR